MADQYPWKARHAGPDGLARLRVDREPTYWTLDQAAEAIAAYYSGVVPRRVGRQTLRRGLDAAVAGGAEPDEPLRTASGRKAPQPSAEDIGYWRGLLVEHKVFRPDGKPESGTARAKAPRASGTRGGARASASSARKPASTAGKSARGAKQAPRQARAKSAR